MKNNRILFISPSLTSGGSERVMALLADEFAQLYTVELCLVREKNDSYKLYNNVKVVRFHAKTNNFILKMIRRLIFMRKEIKKNDCVVSFMFDINFYTLIASIGLHKKIIISERGNPQKENQHDMWVRLGRKALYPLASAVVFQTKQAEMMFPLQIQRKGVIIPNPINPNLPLPWQEEKEKSIVAIGRMTKQKNFAMLIDAFSVFHKKHSEYILTIFGEGRLRKELEAKVSELGLSDYIRMPGFTNNIVSEILKAGMYISSSDFEGISNAMIEALALGIPSICTNCPVGGAEMMIEDGVNGILIPVGDRCALAEAMDKIASDPEFARKLSLESVKVREKYSIKKIYKKWEALF